MLPSWLEPLPDAAQMRETDRWAIEEQGIPGPALMERAGRALAAHVAPEGRVAIVCGAGNNGGDGYVAARLLRERGRDVDVLFAKDPAELEGDARTAFERLQGAPPRPFAPEALDDALTVVDCLLGTGTAGAPRGPAAEAIAAINARGGHVVACDVPSGVDASTGEIAGEAVRADVTVTFHAAKPGLWIAPGKAHCGEVVVADIGIPEGDGAPEPRAGLILPDVLDEHRGRDADGTKFASGHVLVAGGSRGLTGAPCLAAAGAMRAGAGYVTACVPASLEPIFEVKLTEAMTAAVPDDGGALTAAAADAVLERTGRGGALVLGPGIGKAESALEAAREIARRAEVALVLDADGLNAHAGRLGDLRGRPAPTVLTPHGGELARLLDVDGDAVKAARLEHARRASAQAGAILVLKGDDTLVVAPDGLVAVSPGGSPALATAGTGDVLSGVVAAFLARGMEPFAAACAAVHVHAEAGRRAAARMGVEGVVAGDVALELGRVLRDRGTAQPGG